MEDEYGSLIRGVIKQQWWIILIALGLMLPAIFIWSHWWITGALIAYALYILFWLIQFAGITQLEQGKILIERLSYEITSQQVLIKVSAREGMPMKWDQIKKASIGKDHFLLTVNKAQLIHLPFKIFNSENERKFVTSILRTKGFIK